MFSESVTKNLVNTATNCPYTFIMSCPHHQGLGYPPLAFVPLRCNNSNVLFILLLLSLIIIFHWTQYILFLSRPFPHSQLLPKPVSLLENYRFILVDVSVYAACPQQRSSSSPFVLPSTYSAAVRGRRQSTIRSSAVAVRIYLFRFLSVPSCPCAPLVLECCTRLRACRMRGPGAICPGDVVVLPMDVQPATRSIRGSAGRQ